MTFKTPDLCDQYEAELGKTVRVVAPMFQRYGARTAFAGEIVTLKIFEDNSLVREALGQPGQGKVLVVGISLFGEPFQPQRIYQVGEVVSPTEWNGFMYVCEQPGTADSEEPVWPLAEEAAVFVGSAVFRARQYLPIVAHGPLQPEIEVS